MVLRFGRFWKYIRNTWKVLKSNAGEEWRRSAGADRVRNEEILRRVNEERNILRTISRRKANWNCHILRRYCLLKHVLEGKIGRKIKVMGRRGRRCKRLLDDRKEKRRYWKLK